MLGAIAYTPALRAKTADTTTQSLLAKAHDLEIQGQLDVAAQTWQQVLLADPKNTEALAGLARSARISGNPTLASIYLNRLRAINPNDPNVTRAEALPKPPITQTPKGISRQAQEQEAYKALNARNIPEAEGRFKAILASDPKNAPALAGMGYVRLQQSNFSGAASFLEQAKHNGARDSALDTALESARFQQLMSQGSIALGENDLPTAEQQYHAALTLRPGDAEALQGLGDTLLKARQPQAATDVYERCVKAKPTSALAWRGLVTAQYGSGNAPDALATEHRIPPTIRAQLMRDPEYLRSLASAYSAVGRNADAQRTLSSALELPFPSAPKGLQAEIQLQYASLLLQANHLDQAGGLFKQVLAADLSNPAAWQGLIHVEHAMQEDPQAVRSLQAMSPATYKIAMRDPGFQTTVAAVYQNQNKLDIAQDILERSIAQQQAAGQKPSTAVLLQLADICLERHDTEHASSIYRSIVTENSDHPEAWKGLLTVLHASSHDRDAVAQIQQIPQPVRQQLENDPEYLQTVGAVYNALGQPRQAMVFVKRAQQHYTAQHTTVPADVDIQDAWLLFNGGDDTGLYRQLMLLGGRSDLNSEQRRTIQVIWTNWAVRRASQVAASGDNKRSLAILNAAARSFPDNPGVLRALASGYARAGLPEQAIIIFKSQNMTAATASDYKSAVGAALASDEDKLAETWLRYGLEEYPKDAEMLSLAAKFEQARGNSTRAAEYYRASLAALPPGDPAAELAAQLSQPEPANHLPTAAQPQDLATLLTAPDSSAASSQPTVPAKPYLSSYRDASGKAPVEINTNIVPAYMANPNAHTQSSEHAILASYSPKTAGNQAQLQIAENHASAQPLTAQPQDVYGPYVPYVPPTQSGGYTASAVPIQLGNNTPRNLPPQPEITDVLPTARYMPNAQSLSGQSQPSANDNALTTQNVQYTSHPQIPQPFGPGYGQQYPQPEGGPSARTTTHRRTSQTSAGNGTTNITVINQAPASSAAPTNCPCSSQPSTGLGSTDSNPPVPMGESPTDADLMAAGNQPPLRGAYYPSSLGGQPPLAQRAQTELELNSLEGSFSGWLGGTGYGRYRSGTPGFDRLTDVESPFEASAVLGKTVRATIIARPIFLNNGAIDNTFFRSSSGTIPVLGTLPGNVLVAPPEQYASGVGGEIQLASTNFGLALGYTPYDFLVGNIIGRGQWSTFRRHLTFYGVRDSVKDTQLSYAGMRDPGSATPFTAGNIWGGVVSTGGGARLDIGNTKANLYVTGGASELTGVHVLENRRYDGQMGASFNIHRWPGHGTLKIGGDFLAMHYDHNELGMTYGLGGYFSPNVYFFASAPVTYTGYYKDNFHYSITGALGVRSFQEDQAPYFPLDVPLQTASGNAMLPSVTDTALGYSLNSEAAYHFNDHWFVGGFLSANNTSNYNNVSGGFFVRYLFKAQHPIEGYPTGLFPMTGTRALRVP